MKLNSWNWAHLISLYPLAFFLARLLKSEENPLQLKTYMAYLIMGYIFVIIATMAIHMDREEKTGRSFKSKHGKLEEYQTVKSNIPASSLKLYINALHFVSIIIVFYLFSKF